jgi:OPA family sugar phosphate sensor protein UhpC-like MFS transporter
MELRGSQPVLRALVRFFHTGADAPPLVEAQAVRRAYERHRRNVFWSLTLGYTVFYVCRLALSVTKRPMLEAGLVDAADLGAIGSAMLVTYGAGRFTNGILADRSNIRRLMSMGLLVSALLNVLFGAMSTAGAFVVLWAVNGWFQSMGSAPSVVSMSQWFSRTERGTRYGLWSTAHALGEGVTFVGTAALVSALGWRWGFWGSGALGVAAALVMVRTLADRPQTYGLPAVSAYRQDAEEEGGAPAPGAPGELDTASAQRLALRSPMVWVLGMSCALTYVARYAVNSWGVLYLQEAKGYALLDAGAVLSGYPLLGAVGAAASGWVSDRFFGARRFVPTLLFGLLQTGALAAFFAIPPGHPWLDIASLSAFGFALGGMLVFLGGLTAVDLVPKRAVGAAMGLIGLFSYVGAGIQDWVSGRLLHAGRLEVGGVVTYDFTHAIQVWVGASALSVLLALFTRGAQPRA